MSAIEPNNGAGDGTGKVNARNPAAVAERGLLDEYLDRYASDPDYVAEELALNLVEDALAIMRDQGISRARLAEMMGVSKARVTGMFNAPPNLTLRSVAQLALALGMAPRLVLTAASQSVARRPEANDAAVAEGGEHEGTR